MLYKILLHPRATEYLKKTDKKLKERIKNKLIILKKKPYFGERLSFSQFWKLRVGDYRAIYEINRKEKEIIILFIGHRSKVYDDFKRLL